MHIPPPPPPHRLFTVSFISTVTVKSLPLVQSKETVWKICELFFVLYDQKKKKKKKQKKKKKKKRSFKYFACVLSFGISFLIRTQVVNFISDLVLV